MAKNKDGKKNAGFCVLISEKKKRKKEETHIESICARCDGVAIEQQVSEIPSLVGGDDYRSSHTGLQPGRSND